MTDERASSSEPSELRMAAILIWHLRGKADGKEAWTAMLKTEAERRRRVEKFRVELRRIIGERDDIRFRVNGGCVEAEVEDLRFAALELIASKKSEFQTLVTLLGRCPSCGVEVMSEPFYNIAGLGNMLASFEPIDKHFCYGGK